VIAAYLIKDFGLIVNNPGLKRCGPNPTPEEAKDCSIIRDLWIIGGLASATSLAAGVL
jgi:hypothetical protein